MGNYTIFQMFENPRRGRQARNFEENVPKILDLKSSSEQIFSENCVGCPWLFTANNLIFDLGLNVQTQVKFTRICIESSEHNWTNMLRNGDGCSSFQNILTNPIISQINTLLLPYFISHYSSAFTINQAPVVQTVDSAIRRINRELQQRRRRQQPGPSCSKHGQR